MKIYIFLKEAEQKSSFFRIRPSDDPPTPSVLLGEKNCALIIGVTQIFKYKKLILTKTYCPDMDMLKRPPPNLLYIYYKVDGIELGLYSLK